MNQKTITIQGKQYPVIFTMQTLLNFEEIANISFFDAKFKKTTERMAVVIAACLAADENANITIDTLLGGNDYDALKEVIAAFNTVMELSAVFFNIPEIEKQPERHEENTGKN